MPITKTEANDRFLAIAYRGIQWNYAYETGEDIPENEIDGETWCGYYNEECESIFEKQNPEWKIITIYGDTGVVIFGSIDLEDDDDPEHYYLDIMLKSEYEKLQKTPKKFKKTKPKKDRDGISTNATKSPH